MKSGGETVIGRFRPDAAKDANSDGTITEAELREGLLKDDGTKVSEAKPNDYVRFGDKIVQWKDILAHAGDKVTPGGTAETATGLKPDEVLTRSKNEAQKNADAVYQEIQKLNRELSAISDSDPNRREKRSNLREQIQKKVEELRQLNQQMRQANAARGLQNQDEGIRNEWLEATGMQSDYSDDSHRNGGGGGGGGFRAQVVPQAAPGAGAGAGGSQTPATTAGGAGAGGGVPASTFDGLTPPTSPAYAAALFLDADISEGVGSALKNSTEGKKLMMMFLALSRLAEEGSVEWMRMLIKLVGHIIAKTHARNNVAVTSQIIKNLEVQNKATEMLVNTPAGDTPEKMAEFNKSLHQARSMESMANTNIQLMGNMLQEFANGVEAAVNLDKFFVELEGRVNRTATRPA